MSGIYGETSPNVGELRNEVILEQCFRLYPTVYCFSFLQ